jgi:large-conductance mechanosensitive channel
MDQPAKPFTSQIADQRGWIGRLIIAVLLGEAIWGLIVSVMNNVIVPWVGDAMGTSSGLPTSFTQRPYNYPELFVSVFEFCIAGLVAAILNYLLQRPAVRRVKTLKSTPAAAGPIRVVPQVASSSARGDSAPLAFTPAVSPASAPEQDVRMYPVIPSILIPAASETPAPPAAPAPVAKPIEERPIEAKPVAVAPPAPVLAAPAAAKPQPPAPKAAPAKPKKPKNVYYNIVGEPMPSDDD